MLITRPSLFPPFLFLSLSLFLFFFRYHRIAFSLDGESFVPGLFTLNSLAESLGFRLVSAAEKVQRRFERKDERKAGKKIEAGGDEREREKEKEKGSEGGKQISNEGGSPRDKRAPRVREKRRAEERDRDGDRQTSLRDSTSGIEVSGSRQSDRNDECEMAGGTGGWKQDPGQ